MPNVVGMFSIGATVVSTLPLRGGHREPTRVIPVIVFRTSISVSYGSRVYPSKSVNRDASLSAL